MINTLTLGCFNQIHRNAPIERILLKSTIVTDMRPLANQLHLQRRLCVGVHISAVFSEGASLVRELAAGRIMLSAKKRKETGSS